VAFGEALRPEFKTYARKIRTNAHTLAEALKAQGFKLVSNGTENHLMLVDLSSLGITGAQAQTALDRAGITVNKNAIPNDPQPPTKTSGVRIGTPAVTTRGMGESEMQRIAGWIAQVLQNRRDEALAQRVADEVREMCAAFPVPGHENYVEELVPSEE
jgi:glycine hydroxymethyltransferase